MSGLIRKLVLGTLLVTGGLACWAPTPAQADPEDRYWRHYRRWYDSTYRPYYHRRYYYAPPPAPYYGGTTYYSPAPVYRYGRGGVVLRYGWW